jgi:DNA-directed RNA polymerase specialized sigma24 family protein
MLTARKAFQERRRQQASKRGGQRAGKGVRPSEITGSDPFSGSDPVSGRGAARLELMELDEIIGTEPDPQFAVLVADHLESLLKLLPDEDLRRIVRLRLEAHTSAEIADQLRCSERTIERKLVLIRSFWEKSLET